MKKLAMFGAIVGAAVAVAVGWYLMKPKPPPLKVGSYPKLVMYGWQRWNGPFLKGTPFVIDTALVDRAAVYDLIMLDPFRVGQNSDVQRMIRERAPNAIRVSYFDAGRFYQCGDTWVGGDVPYGCDTTGQNAAWSRWIVVRAHNAVLWRKSGALHDRNIDYAQPGLAEHMADTVMAWMTDNFNGVFIDELNNDIRWTFPKTDSVDYARAGFPSALAWHEAYYAGVNRFYARMRELLGTKWLLGNAGQRGIYSCNGWMRENNPFQPNDTMTEYLLADSLHTQPPANMRTAWMPHANFTDPYAQRRARFTLAFATMGEGYGGPTWSPTDMSRGWGYSDLWMDEYAVDSSGSSTRDAAYKGWLGLPLGPAYRVADPLGGEQTHAWRRDFQKGCVLLYYGSTGVGTFQCNGYNRIRGVMDPVRNSGLPVDQVQLVPGEALFLVKS